MMTLEDRLRNMMSIFEKKTAIKTFNEFEIDYYLDDGSLLGDLIRPIPGDKSISSENKEIIVDIVKDRLYKEIESNEVQISSFKYKEEFKELFDDHFSIMDKKESEELALETLDCDNNQSTLESFFIPKSSN